MFTNSEETKFRDKRSPESKWTRKQARGILTTNERRFLQGKVECSSSMFRYFRSHILRKTKKAIEDLDLILKKYEVRQIFFDDKPNVEKSIKEAVKFQYYKNYLTELNRRLDRKVKRQIDKDAISQKTEEQLNEIMNSVLNDLRTKKP